MINTKAAEFIRALGADLARRTAEDGRLVPFAELVRGVDCVTARYQKVEPFDHPTMRFLDAAVGSASGVPEVLQATRAIAHAVRWYQIYRGGGLDPALAEGLLAAQVAGNVGVFPSDEIRCGMFLLAPGIHYPLHTHGASEIYYCLSGDVEIAHGIDAGSFRLGPGKLSLTPPNRIHSLTTHDAPVLLLYVWTGAVDAPNWWWERRADGGWTRSQWVRRADASWARTVTEPVTARTMREATGT